MDGLETLVREVVGDNCSSTMAILRHEEIDIKAFYALDSDTLVQIGR